MKITKEQAINAHNAIFQDEMLGKDSDEVPIMVSGRAFVVASIAFPGVCKFIPRELAGKIHKGKPIKEIQAEAAEFYRAMADALESGGENAI